MNRVKQNVHILTDSHKMLTEQIQNQYALINLIQVRGGAHSKLYHKLELKLVQLKNHLQEC